jgi:hypothetical protein
MELLFNDPFLQEKDERRLLAREQALKHLAYHDSFETSPTIVSYNASAVKNLQRHE